MTEFFERNLSVITEEEQQVLANKKVLVIGCGGLGGSIIELLCRFGFSNLTVIDADVFEPSNMNRQLLCTTQTLGRKKAEAAAQRAKMINPDIRIEAVTAFFDESNAGELVHGKDLVIDALDSLESRLLAEEICEKEGVYLVHGAVYGWMIQTAVCPPGKRVLHKLYGLAKNSPAKGGGISMNVASCASFEVTEAVKFLLGRPDVLEGKVLFFDLMTKENYTIDMME